MDTVLETNPFRLSIKELRARCQGTAPAPERETFTGKKARFFSIYLTRLLLLTSITPNKITVISVLVFMTGVFLFLTQNYVAAIIGSLLVFFATVLDGCDGEIARFRSLKYAAGALYVEPVSHDVQYGVMFLPLGIAAAVASGSWVPLAFAFSAGASKLMARLLENRHWFFTHAIILAEADIHKIRADFKARPAWRRLISWTKRNLFTSNGMILPLFLAAAFNRLDWYLFFYGVCFPLLWALIFAKQVRSVDFRAPAAAAKTEGGAAE